jgi:toxin ParE1/3/4
MSRCHFTTPAYRDLEAIHDYIAADSAAAAARWIDRLERECQNLADMPGMGRRREELAPGLRGFPVGTYVIFYREVEDGIQILRVVHGARDIESLFP